ncbi:MAG: hypothetical protein DYH05_14295 [Acidobacteria bacterium ACB1]|nr:hypothetical protein [Pyrinomonadaceae bacterium]MCE7963642.1 hypothetical protein [Acidobacteria bacterium ACB1]
MNINWIEFSEGPIVQDAETIRVTMTRTGTFYLNGAALKALGHPDAVVLFYDTRLQLIGIKRSSITVANAFILKKKDGERVNARIFYAANFCRHFQIRPMETILFRSPVMDGDILVLSLHTTGPARGWNKQKTEA